MTTASTLDLDRAIEILEITDISKVTVETLPSIKRKAQLRWHPDRIAATKPDEATLKHYNETFNLIEPAVEIVKSFLEGNYKAGQSFSKQYEEPPQQPEEIIRSNAPQMQQKLNEIWQLIKTKGIQHTVEEVLVADGFKLKDLLMEDLKDDAPTISLASFFYGFFLVLPLMIIGAFAPPVMTVAAILWLVQAVSCILIFLPLSRIWMPQQITDIALWFVNTGMRLRDWVMENWGHNNFIIILVSLPALFAKAVKYIILYPLYFLAGEILKDKVVGQIKTQVNYYAGIAEWYINDLLGKSPSEMTVEELYVLSHLYTNLSDTKQ